MLIFGFCVLQLCKNATVRNQGTLKCEPILQWTPKLPTMFETLVDVPIPLSLVVEDIMNKLTRRTGGVLENVTSWYLQATVPRPGNPVGLLNQSKRCFETRESVISACQPLRAITVQIKELVPVYHQRASTSRHLCLVRHPVPTYHGRRRLHN